MSVCAQGGRVQGVCVNVGGCIGQAMRMNTWMSGVIKKLKY